MVDIIKVPSERTFLETGNSPSFKAQDKVWVQDTLCKIWEKGIIINKLDQPRSLFF